MTLAQWIGEKLHGPRHHIRDAIAATDESTMHVRSVREQLKPYSLELDPFVAMVRNRLLAEDYATRHGNGST